MFKINDNISAIIIANQMPLIPKISGINNTDNVWKIKVLQVDEIAEIKPLFKAVKNDEVNTFKPYIMKENA